MITLETTTSGAGFELLNNTVNINKLPKMFMDRTNYYLIINHIITQIY